MLFFFGTVLAAIAARWMTELAHWQIAVGLTLALAAFRYAADLPEISVDGTLTLIVSPAIFAIIWLFLVPIGWLKKKFKRHNWGRQQQAASAKE